MIHSKNIHKNTLEITKETSIEVIFDNLDLKEEIRVNEIFKGWNIGRPEYKRNEFTKLYTKK